MTSEKRFAYRFPVPTVVTEIEVDGDGLLTVYGGGKAVLIQLRNPSLFKADAIEESNLLKQERDELVRERNELQSAMIEITAIAEEFV